MTSMKLLTFFSGLLAMHSLLQAAEPALDWRSVETARPVWIKKPEAELRQLAEAGDALAKFFYHLTSPYNEQTRERYQRGARYLEEASAAGIPQAMFAWSQRMKEGNPAALTLATAAADKGYPPALHAIAEEHLEGDVRPLDEARALELLRRAADAGYAISQFELAEMYAYGQGEPRHDGETPLKLYQAAAKGGVDGAMEELSRRYRLGWSVERDLGAAVRWHWQATGGLERGLERFLDDQGEPMRSIQPNRAEFAQFYSLYFKARSTRQPEAMRKAGLAFQKAKQTRDNAKSAWFWLALAARAGDSIAAKNEAAAKAALTDAEVNEVEKEIANLKPLKPPQPPRTRVTRPPQ